MFILVCVLHNLGKSMYIKSVSFKIHVLTKSKEQTYI